MMKQTLYSALLYILSAFLAFAMISPIERLSDDPRGIISIGLFGVIILGSLRQIFKYSVPARFYGGSIFLLVLSIGATLRGIRVSQKAFIAIPALLAGAAVVFLLGKKSTQRKTTDTSEGNANVKE